MRDFWSKRNYSFENIPDLTGKIAIITGSNSGVSILLFFLVILSCNSFTTQDWQGVCLGNGKKGMHSVCFTILKIPPY